MNDAAGHALGRVLMITGRQAWRDMPDGGAAALYEELPTDSEVPPRLMAAKA